MPEGKGATDAACRKSSGGMREALSQFGHEKHITMCICEGLTPNMNGCDNILVFHERQRLPTALLVHLSTHDEA